MSLATHLVLRKVASVALTLAISPIAPALADGLPYFRMNVGSGLGGGAPVANPDTETRDPALNTLRPGSPGGPFVGRIGVPFATPSPAVPNAPSGLTWHLEVGPLPAGLSVNRSTGAVAGTPSTIGTASPVSLTATAPNGAYGTTPAFAIQVLGKPSVSYANLKAPGSSGLRLFPVSSNVSGGARYDVVSSSLPAGLSINHATGLISGTPTAVGKVSGIRVEVVDVDNARATSEPFSIEATGAFAELKAGSPRARTDLPFALTFSKEGLVAPVTYSVAPGSSPLPPGVGLEGANERLAGVPTAVGVFDNIVVQAVDAVGTPAWTPPFSVTTYSPAVAMPGRTLSVGKQVTLVPTATDIESDRTWSLAGALPDGMTFSAADGSIAGTPGTVGSWKGLVVSATDSGGTYPSAPFTLEVAVDSLAVTTEQSLYRMRTGAGFRMQVSAPDATNPVTWSKASGTFPAGLALDAAGVVAGVPTQAGLGTGVVISATDSKGRTGSTQPVTFHVFNPPSVNPAEVYTAFVGKAYDVQIPSTDVIGTPAFTLTDADLPAGLSVSATGRIGGTPSAVGSAAGIVATLTDSFDGATARSRPFTVKVVDAGTEFIVAGTQSNYRARLNRTFASPAPSALNATGPVTWTLSATSPALPTGLGVNAATGAITGSPTAVATVADATLTATDTVSRKTARSDPFTVQTVPELAVSGVEGTYDLRVGSQVALQPAVTGVIGSATWEVSGGSLPLGVRLDSATGAIKGQPLVSGVSPQAPATGLVLRATDSYDASTAVSKPFSIAVAPGLVVVGPSLLNGRAGVAFDSAASYVATNADPKQDRAWSVVAGTLPEGLAIDVRTGAIKGVPTTEQTQTGIRLRVVQADGTYGETGSITIAIRGTVRIDVAPLQTFRVNVAGSFAPAAVNATYGPTGALRWSIAEGTVPPGMKFSPTTGAVSGTPTVVGTYGGLRFKVIDATGATALSSAVTVVVNGGMTWGRGYDFTPFRRSPDPFVSNTPSVNGAVGKVTYAFEGNGTMYGWVVDRDTGVISGNTARERNGTFLGDYSSQPWIVARDAAGGSVRAPSTYYLGQDAITWYDCQSYCTRQFQKGDPIVWQTEYVFWTLGEVTYDYAPGSARYDWLTLDRKTGNLLGDKPDLGTYPVTIRLTDAADGKTADSTRTMVVVPRPTPPADGNLLFKTRGRGVGTSWTSPPVVDMSGLPGPYSFEGHFTTQYTDVGISGDQRQIAVARTSGFNPGIITGSYIEGTASDGTKRRVNYTIDAAPVLESNWPQPAACLRTGDSFDSGPFVMSGVRGNGAFRITDYYGGWPVGTPNGLSFDASNGRIFGTFTGGAYHDGSLALKYLDDWDGSDAKSLSFYIYTLPKLAFSVPSLTLKAGDFAYITYNREGLDWRGADIQYVSGRLPDGMRSYYQEGADGVPREKGTFPIRVSMTPRVTCGTNPGPIFADAVITVTPGLVPTYPDTVYLRQGIYGRTAAPSALDAAGAVNWSLDRGTLPSGTTLDSGSGQIVGTPTAAGTYPNLVGMAADGKQYAPSNTFTLVVTPGPAIVTQPTYTLPAGSYAEIRPETANVAGSATWAASVALPAGMVLDTASGAIRGTPTTAGTTGPIVLSLKDEGGAPATSQGFGIVVTKPAATVSVPENTEAVRDATVTVTPATTNVAGPATWTLGGSPPPGTGINGSTGVLSGKATATGTFGDLRLSATGSDGVTTVSNAFTVKVSDVPVTPTCVPNFGTWRGSVSEVLPITCQGCFFAYQYWECVGDSCSGLPANAGETGRSAANGEMCNSVPGNYPGCTIGDRPGTALPGQTLCQSTTSPSQPVESTPETPTPPRPPTAPTTSAWTYKRFHTGVGVGGNYGMILTCMSNGTFRPDAECGERPIAKSSCSVPFTSAGSFDNPCTPGIPLDFTPPPPVSRW
jgi:hypothetical protein